MPPFNWLRKIQSCSGFEKMFWFDIDFDSEPFIVRSLCLQQTIVVVQLQKLNTALHIQGPYINDVNKNLRIFKNMAIV